MNISQFTTGAKNNTRQKYLHNVKYLHFQSIRLRYWPDNKCRPSIDVSLSRCCILLNLVGIYGQHECWLHYVQANSKLECFRAPWIFLFCFCEFFYFTPPFTLFESLRKSILSRWPGIWPGIDQISTPNDPLMFPKCINLIVSSKKGPKKI